MGYQTATNPDTGERVILVDNEWKPVEQSATNKQGVKAYKVGGAWLTDETPKADAIPQRKIASPAWAAARPFVEPVVTTGGMLAGGAVGSLGGPAGTVAGAAGGYATGEALLRAIDQASGNAPSMTPMQGLETGTKDLLMGAIYEAGGRVAAPFIEKALSTGAKGMGWLYDTLTGQLGKQKAAKILRDSLGIDVGAVRELAKSAPTTATAAQSIADLTSPTTQALLEQAAARDPHYLLSTQEAQEAARLNQLATLAGGESQTAAKTARGEAKNALSQRLWPQGEAELRAANTAGELEPALRAQAERMGQAAAGKVQDVRRFTAAAERAGETAGKLQTAERGMPVPGRYTYTGELAKRAEDVANQAAQGSLIFGEASRFATAAADSLAQHGLKPLKTDSIVRNIERASENPNFAGNRDVRATLNQVKEDIQHWTNTGGVIDAFALDSIRKNSVNAAVRQLYPNADVKVQKELAAKVLGEVRPLIIDAVENAGGAGYRNYLEAYSKGLQAVNQQKLSARALELYQSNPKEFVRLVEGNKPKEVEKIFGGGSYDIAKEMSDSAMQTLKGVAGEVKKGERIEKQVLAGQDALRELLEANKSKFRFPDFAFNRGTTAGNAALDTLAKKLGKKVMQTLTDASKSGQDMAKLLDTMPAADRNAVLRALKNPQEWIAAPAKGAGAASRGAAANLLAPESINELRND